MHRANNLIILLALLPASARADNTPDTGLQLFKEHVRADLAHHCLECHGGRSVKGDFSLATRELLLDSGFVGDTAADSYLMDLLLHTAEPAMPFKKPKLSSEIIERIGRWIDAGAPYDRPFNSKSNPEGSITVTDEDRDFWAFRPLVAQTPPSPEQPGWCRTEIDSFILAELEDNGLTPNETADRRTLIRRAYYGLLGLPPSPEQVEAFVNNESPDAWPELIDQLLASPHYGERWARTWMDVARFAESHGYEQDYDRPHAYHYRDFLIKALNEDMPYDQFVHWQLAGDELGPDNPLAITATGFLGAGVFPTQLTEAEFESARYDELDDMVTTTGVAFLGLSVGCARCHDHKFDPIPAVDYYRMAATFTSTIRSEIELDLDPDANQRRQEEWQSKLDTLTREREQFIQNELPVRFQKFLTTWSGEDQTPVWSAPKITEIISSAGTKFEPLPDGSWLAGGNPPNKEVITIHLGPQPGSVAAIRLETLTHDSLPRRGPGRAPNGNFALGHIRALHYSGDATNPPRALSFATARATHEQNSGDLSVAASIDEDPVSGWAVDAGGIGKDQAAVFEFKNPIHLKPGDSLSIQLTLNHPNTKHTIGRFRLSTTGQRGVVAAVGHEDRPPGVPEALKDIQAGAGADSEAMQTGLRWFQSTVPELQALDREMTRHRQIPHQGRQLTKAMISSEGYPHMKHHADGRGYPHFYPTTHVLDRGDPNQKREVAEPGFLQVLMPPDAKTNDWSVKPPDGWTRTSFRRATLAHWMTDTETGAGNLAARVIVNRVWHHHFGRGLVATPNDFGLSGDRPTHPELLNWLARDFVKHGWKIKRLHKQIMLSSVYRQSSDFDEDRAVIDRENHFLWRRTPRRLEAESIRDSMLAVSGLLDTTMYGPGTLDPKMSRRSIYFFIKRSRLIQEMMLFDWPEHLVSIGARGSTTIAPQALMFMNSPQTRRYAAAFASRLPDSTEDAVTAAFQLAFSRTPSSEERAASVAFIERQQENYAQQGMANPDQIARIDFCQTLFSMNEFIYLD